MNRRQRPLHSAALRYLESHDSTGCEADWGQVTWLVAGGGGVAKWAGAVDNTTGRR